jgi:TatD DNase family protein
MNNELITKLIDTHCHLDFPDFKDDLDQVIQRAKDAGVAYLINIGASTQGSCDSVELAKKYDCLYASVGVHPHEADAADKNTDAILKALAKKEKVVAIGEIGLDFFKNYSKAENQKKLFESLIGLAKDLNLPLVIHSRQAESDTLEALKKFMPLRAVVHCFSGGPDFLKECLELGFFISFTCNITYKKAQNLREILKAVPLERLMLETDAPFLSPEGFRGRRNEPMQVKILAEEIAAIKEMDFQEVARITTDNAKNFFNLK